MVRLLESLVLLASPEIDAALIAKSVDDSNSNTISTVIRLFFKYDSANMLHQAVANLLVHVIEGERTELQEFIFLQCNLLEMLMECFEQEESRERPRKGNMGHVIIVSQAIVSACTEGNAIDLEDVGLADLGLENSAKGENNADNNDDNVEDDDDHDDNNTDKMHDDNKEKNNNENNENNNNESVLTNANKKNNVLLNIVKRAKSLDKWNEFAITTLNTATLTQSTPLGGKYFYASQEGERTQRKSEIIKNTPGSARFR